MDKNILNKITDIFENRPEVKLAYLFGSRAQGNESPLSDYDFALYLESDNPKQRSEIKVDILNELSDALRSDNIDVVVLNDTDEPEMKYNIIADGKLVYAENPYKLLVEPRILSEYFDFRQSLVRHGLSKPTKGEERYIR